MKTYTELFWETLAILAMGWFVWFCSVGIFRIAQTLVTGG